MGDETEKPDILSAFGVQNNTASNDEDENVTVGQTGNTQGADILSAFGVDSTATPVAPSPDFSSAPVKGNETGADILSVFDVTEPTTDQVEPVDSVTTTEDTVDIAPTPQRNVTVANEQEFSERIAALEYEYGDSFYEIPEDWGLDSRIGTQFGTDLREALANEVQRSESESGIQNLEYAGLLEEQGVDPVVQVPIRDPEEIQRRLEEQADTVQALLDDPNASRSRITQELLDRGLSLKDIITSVTVLEIAPVSGTYLGVQDLPIMYEQARQQYQEGDIGGAATTVGLMGLETLASVAGTAAGVKAVADVTRTARATRTLRNAYRNNVAIAEAATSDAAREAAERASQVAANNQPVAEELIRAFEARTGKTISTTTEDGRLVIDPDLSRQAGQETMLDVAGTDLAAGADELLQPILRPERFDAIVAIASDYKQRYPDAFTGDKTVIDGLFDLTVNRELLGGQELLDDLNKYGLSFEDYILTVVGSGSEAGKILNQLSQISRTRPTGVAQEAASKAALEAENAIRRGVMRLENVRRGGLVSQLATAARNLTSATIRVPMEALGNIMDTAIYRATNEGTVAGIMELFSKQNRKDSFAQFGLIFSRPDVARAYTDFILQRPELANQYDRMFNNINEIQALTGRGSGTMFDKVVSLMEDAVDFLNTPNRWQEHLIRRGVFFSELQRLTRNEYGVDLIDTLQAGKLQDLLNDAGGIRPEGSRSFLGLVDNAVTKSLDVTYAKQPDIATFREMSSFIVRNGLTVVAPFPRFMFNSMELMGQYAAGSSIPLTRKIASLVTGGRVGAGPLTAKDRQRITRNLIGLSAMFAAYQYRMSEDAPADYKQMNTSEGVVMDTSPQFPMRQFLFIGEAGKRLRDGTFDNWFDAREFAETFSGSNLRAGAGNAIIDEIASLADGTDLTKGETRGKIAGRLLGEYLSSWLVPFAQIVEAQRATGERGLEYRDVREDPTLDGWTTFFNELGRPTAQRGVSLTAEEEAALPLREYVFSENRRRVGQMSRVLLGLSQSSATSEYGQYYINKGFNEFDLSSTSEVPTVQRWENEQIRKVLPIIAEAAQRREETLRREYADMSDIYKDSFTEQQHINNNVIPLINGFVRDLRSNLREMNVGAENPYTNAVVQYRRIPPDIRKLATNYFVERFDREPDPTNTRDLQSLVMLGGALRQTYR
jgi:uncharacterized protein YciW